MDRLFAYQQVDVVGRGLALLHQKLGENGLWLQNKQLEKFIGFIRNNDIQDYPTVIQGFLNNTDASTASSIKVHLDFGCFWHSRSYAVGFTMQLSPEDTLDVIRRVKPTGSVSLSYRKIASLSMAAIETLGQTPFNIHNLNLLGTGLDAQKALHLVAALRPGGNVNLSTLDLSSLTPHMIQRVLGSRNLAIQGLDLDGTNITGPAAMALIAVTKATVISLNDVDLSRLTSNTIYDQLYGKNLDTKAVHLKDTHISSEAAVALLKHLKPSEEIVISKLDLSAVNSDFVSDSLTHPSAPRLNLKKLVILDSKIAFSALLALIRIYNPTDELDLSDSRINKDKHPPRRTISLGNDIHVKKLNVSRTQLAPEDILFLTRETHVSEELRYSNMSKVTLELVNDRFRGVNLEKLCAWDAPYRHKI